MEKYFNDIKIIIIILGTHHFHSDPPYGGVSLAANWWESVFKGNKKIEEVGKIFSKGFNKKVRW